MNKEKLESAKRIFLFTLYADIAVTAFVVVSDFWGVGVLSDIGSGRIEANPSTISWLEFWDSFSLIMVLTLLGIGFGLSKWLMNCYSYAKDVIGAKGFKNEKWVLSGWVIPVFNLFKPYQVINEIYKAGGHSYVSSEGWKNQRGSGLLLTWWIFWAVTHLIGWMVGKLLLKNAFRTDMNLEQAIGSIEFHAWFCIVFMVVSVLWVFVANALTSRLLGRNVIGEQTLSIELDSLDIQKHEQKPLNVKPSIGTQTVTVHSTSESLHVKSPSSKNSDGSKRLAVPLSVGGGQPSEEDHWASAMNELEIGQRRPGIWARAYAEAEGDETKAKVAYLKVRVQQLSEEAKQLAIAQESAKQEVLKKEQLTIIENKRKLEDLLFKFEQAEEMSDEQLSKLVSAMGGDNVNVIRQKATGNTLLHLCAERGLTREVHALMEADADPNLSNNSGVRPVFMSNDKLIVDLLNGLKVNSDLLERLMKSSAGLCPQCGEVLPHVKTDLICPNCHTFFNSQNSLKIKEHSHQEILNALKFSYSTGKRPTENQVKYLVDAATSDQTLITLVDQGKHGATLLHWCAHFNLVDQAKFLLQLGANARIKSANFTMPYEWCGAGVLRRILEEEALGL